MRLLFALFIFVLIVCPVFAQADFNVLTLVTHDSFAVSEDVLAQFEAEAGITVQILRSGDAGTMVNQAILSKENPQGDVLYGVDNTFLSRALSADLFIPYESPALVNVSEEFILDSEHRVTPVDYGDVCLNYDASYFEENNLQLPESLTELTDPRYEGLLVVENPAISSPGLAFLLTTIAAFGSEGEYTYLEYWIDLVENDVLIANDWTDAYFGQFSGSTGSEGTRPLVVSYASSPPVEVYFMEALPETAPTGSIVADGMCFRQIEFVGILDGTDNLEDAQKFVDFMLGVQFQEDMPLQMFVYPVNAEANLPDVFVEYSSIPEKPVYMDISEIDMNREEWIQAWTETVLR
jgi:thiamine transport system substrate-binding protein